MHKNVACFKRMQKNDAFRTLKNAVPNPAYLITYFDENYNARNTFYAEFNC